MFNSNYLFLQKTEKLKYDLQKLLIDEEFYDVKLRIGEEKEEFYVHSIILKARSKYFATAFSKRCSRWIKKDSQGIILFDKPNIKPDNFRIILK